MQVTTKINFIRERLNAESEMMLTATTRVNLPLGHEYSDVGR